MKAKNIGLVTTTALAAYSVYKICKKREPKYSIGVDIVDMRRDIDIEKLASVILSDNEFLYFKQLTGKRKSEFLFGRLAAKEAFMKAKGKGIDQMRLRDIDISYLKSGKPTIKEENCDVSISHDGDYAIANVIITE